MGYLTNWHSIIGNCTIWHNFKSKASIQVGIYFERLNSMETDQLFVTVALF